MEMRAVVEVETQTYHEQQFVLAKFPSAIWIPVGEDKIRFYFPYSQYHEIGRLVSEWAMKEATERNKNVNEDV